MGHCAEDSIRYAVNFDVLSEVLRVCGYEIAWLGARHVKVGRECFCCGCKIGSDECHGEELAVSSSHLGKARLFVAEEER